MAGGFPEFELIVCKPPVIIGFAMLGIDIKGTVVIADGAPVITHEVFGNASAYVCIRIIGLKFNGFVEIPDGADVVVEIILGYAAVVVGFGIVWIGFDQIAAALHFVIIRADVLALNDCQRDDEEYDELFHGG